MQLCGGFDTIMVLSLLTDDASCVMSLKRPRTKQLVRAEQMLSAFTGDAAMQEDM